MSSIEKSFVFKADVAVDPLGDRARGVGLLILSSEAPALLEQLRLHRIRF
jgi:hypothetical protein